MQTDNPTADDGEKWQLFRDHLFLHSTSKWTTRHNSKQKDETKINWVLEMGNFEEPTIFPGCTILNKSKTNDKAYVIFEKWRDSKELNEDRET